uniref:Uncharacterized protein n=1 Tax=Fagus sylvatica TaxID=28930 RepID=A0A2N9G830_FAGSY
MIERATSLSVILTCPRPVSHLFFLTYSWRDRGPQQSVDGTAQAVNLDSRLLDLQSSDLAPLLMCTLTMQQLFHSSSVNIKPEVNQLPKNPKSTVQPLANCRSSDFEEDNQESLHCCIQWVCQRSCCPCSRDKIRLYLRQLVLLAKAENLEREDGASMTIRSSSVRLMVFAAGAERGDFKGRSFIQHHFNIKAD